MKRLVFVVSVALVAAVTASAQVSVRQRVWLRGTTFVVFNDTDDRKPARLHLDGAEVATIPHGGKWSTNIGGGFFIFYEPYTSKEFLLTIQVCESLVPATLIIEPPSWATDGLLLGPLALSTNTIPTKESALKKRVEEIKKFLDKREVLGRKKMKKELSRWFDEIKKFGFSLVAAGCSNSKTSGVRTRINSDWFYNTKHVRAAYVRGNRESGYRIDMPGYMY